MPPSDEDALEILQKIAKDMKLPRAVENCMYRSDYQDFLVLLEDDFLCTIREKLMDVHIADPTNKDILHEIEFRLANAEQLEEEVYEDGGSDQVV